jgi:NAD(P)-dependent dehydrogenase (short-subunit alcohol dehydrogenase family)
MVPTHASAAAGAHERDGAAGGDSVGVTRLFGLDGKVALVTGGGQGIGRMIAGGLVEAGAKVYIASRKLDVCEAVAAELSAGGVSCIAMQADLSTEAGCLALAGTMRDLEPQLHVLVNNAGATWGAPFEQYPDEAWDRALDLNVRAVFRLTRALVEPLAAGARPRDPARVINIGSVDGLHVPTFETYAYSASKAALHHLTKVLAKTLGPRNIAVNAVAPGPFESKMMRATLAEFGEDIAAATPLGRIGVPDDMAGVAIYLASRASAYVTGAVIPVDGGLTTTL